jgi:hypothetical protein
MSHWDAVYSRTASSASMRTKWYVNFIRKR